MQIMQFRYFGLENDDTKINNIWPDDNNQLVIKDYGRIHKLSVQALPGTSLKINNTGEIIIGQYGNYQLNLDNSYIDSIYITIPENLGNGIIVDILCEGGNN